MTITLSDPPAPSNPEKGTIIKILQGGLLDQTGMAAIVFFMGERLEWESPLNHRILERFGQNLDEYILEHVISPRKGDAYLIAEDVHSAPRLILGILPKWDGGMDDEERVLKKCIRSILSVADDAGLSSVAIPALGMSRKKDIPVRRAARLTYTVLSEFPYRSLKEVRVMCKTPEIYEAYGR